MTPTRKDVEPTTSATDELRRLLDERGVEYETYIEQPTGFEHVKWNFSEHGSADFNLEFGEPWLTMYGVISGPEQAIAATLGAGTCHLKPWEMERDTGFYDSMECDCGYVADVADWASWHFCPSCGRQNVGVDE